MRRLSRRGAASAVASTSRCAIPNRSPPQAAKQAKEAAAAKKAEAAKAQEKKKVAAAAKKVRAGVLEPSRGLHCLPSAAIARGWALRDLASTETERLTDTESHASPARGERRTNAQAEAAKRAEAAKAKAKASKPKPAPKAKPDKVLARAQRIF